jgi:hypothetical protein
MIPTYADSTGQKPADNYDIAITNGYGIDITGGSLADRDEANNEQAFPMRILAVSGDNDTLPEPVFNVSALTVAITNIDIPSARGAIKILWQEK